MTKYPLAWPHGWKRVPSHLRRRARFHETSRQYSSTPGGGSWLKKRDLSVADATGRILDELRRFGVLDGDAIISTNLKLRLDGLPRSDQAAPADPGVAVYWTRHGEGQAMKCMAIDLYDRVADNLAAIAATLEAMRAIERHGGAQVLDRAFTGFTALPPPVVASRPWRDVLEVGALDATVEAVQASYRRARSKAHPDKGGTTDQYLAVEAAYREAARELGFTP